MFLGINMGTCLKQCDSLLRKYVENYGIVIIWAVTALLLMIAFWQQNLELISVGIFGAFTAHFAYMAFYHTGENFRLELFEKRLMVYNGILNFAQLVEGVRADGQLLSLDAKREAEKIFLSKGYHEVQFLFGEDISSLQKQLRDIFNDLNTRDHTDFRREQALSDLGKITETLPEIFKPYIYFGNYKV